MNTSARMVVLLLIDQLGGEVHSKTLVMKHVYFLGELLGISDLGFHAHYYGPYSEEVADAMSQLVQMGFMDEKCLQLGYNNRGFERCRYSYSLTDDGRAILRELKETLGEQLSGFTKTIQSLGKAAEHMNYMDVSYAAKTRFLLKQAGKPMTTDEIREAAARFSWSLAEHDVEKSIHFLSEIGLAETR